MGGAALFLYIAYIGLSRQLLIGVGIVIAHNPLRGPGRALISASGSYLGCLAAKRSAGYGWSTRGCGSQRSPNANVRIHENGCF